MSHHILSPSSPQMFRTTSTEIFSGLRSASCCPAQPPSDHPALWTVKLHSTQPGPEGDIIKSIRGNNKSLLRRDEQGVRNSTFFLLHHHRTSNGPCSPLPPMNLHQHKHMENLREGSTVMPKTIHNTRGVAAWSTPPAFPGSNCRACSCFPAEGMMSLYKAFCTDRCKIRSLSGAQHCWLHRPLNKEVRDQHRATGPWRLWLHFDSKLT